jgi:tetratricopeptide (TPR) repeat protein
MKGDLAAAVLDLDAALRLKPDYADAYARRGMARLEQNRKSEAEKDLQKALELLPARSPQRAPLEEALQRARAP